MSAAMHRRIEHKPTIEEKIAISVFDLKKASAEDHKKLPRYWFMSNGIAFNWVRDTAAHDSYIELIHRGPRNTQSTFNLATTPCTYGGERWWLECPRCNRRVTKLYKENDNFECRTCLGLEYSSHRRNYRSFEPFIVRMLEYEKMEPRSAYISYRGRITKRTRREEKLRLQVEMGAPLAGRQLKK